MNTIKITLESFFKQQCKYLRNYAQGQHGSLFYAQLEGGIRLFVKHYTHEEHCKAEINGLKTLAQYINIPPLLHHNSALIILQFIESPNKNLENWKLAAHQLASLHAVSHTSFGLDHHNFIGKSPQINHPENQWSSFYITHRLLPQMQWAQKHNLLKPTMHNKLKTLINNLHTWAWPSDLKPSLCHGDLWRGNILFGAEGCPYFIDPAIYFADPETDLAMAKLFGGFPAVFFDTYYQMYPQKEGYEQREKLYQLYHLLNHVNIFGSAYLNQCEALLNSLLISSSP